MAQCDDAKIRPQLGLVEAKLVWLQSLSVRSSDVREYGIGPHGKPMLIRLMYLNTMYIGSSTLDATINNPTSLFLSY